MPLLLLTDLNVHDIQPYSSMCPIAASFVSVHSILRSRKNMRRKQVVHTSEREIHFN